MEQMNTQGENFKVDAQLASGLMTHLACGQDRVRRSLLHTYTDLDPEAAAGHQVPPFLLMETMCFAMQSLVDKVTRCHSPDCTALW